MVGIQETKSCEWPSWSRCWIVAYQCRRWHGCTPRLLRHTPKGRQRPPSNLHRSFGLDQRVCRVDLAITRRPIRCSWPRWRPRRTPHLVSHFWFEISIVALMTWSPILGSQGQRDSSFPPLQCPLGIPNWSGQHQERRWGTPPSVTQTCEEDRSEVFPDSIIIVVLPLLLLLNGDIINGGLLLIFPNFFLLLVELTMIDLKTLTTKLGRLLRTVIMNENDNKYSYKKILIWWCHWNKNWHKDK